MPTATTRKPAVKKPVLTEFFVAPEEDTYEGTVYSAATVEAALDMFIEDNESSYNHYDNLTVYQMVGNYEAVNTQRVWKKL